MISYSSEILINNKKVNIEVSLKLKGYWRVNEYSGTFEVIDREIKVKIGARSIVKGIFKRERAEGLNEALKDISKTLGIKIRVEGPLSIKLFEYS